MSGYASEAIAKPVDIAIIANANTPYRTHLHLRLVDELPEVRLWSVFTHELSNAPWRLRMPERARPVLFGTGEPSETQGKFSGTLHEWTKGGRIIEFLKNQRVQAVVLLGYNDAGRLRILRWCARNRVPCLLWGDSNVMGDAATGLKAQLKRLILPRIVSRCCAILACGTLGRAYFERYGAAPERIFFSPYEPDYTRIRTVTPERITQVGTRFTMRRGRRHIVFSGRLVQVKRVDLVLDAFAAIAQRRANWDLVIVGAGPLEAALRQRVPATMRDRITWTGFLEDPNDVAAIYRQSDVLVLASDYEPWAVVINEAVAAGMAVVGVRIAGAVAELVRDGVNGATFPPGDLQALTERLLEVTAPERIDGLKAASFEVLADWQRRGDPVKGLKDALEFCGVLPRSRAIH